MTVGSTVTDRVTYAYDAWGDRVGRDAWNSTTGGTSERDAVDRWDTAKQAAVGDEDADTWAELSGSNALVTRRISGPGTDEAVVRQTAAGAQNSGIGRTSAGRSAR